MCLRAPVKVRHYGCGTWTHLPMIPLAGQKMPASRSGRRTANHLPFLPMANSSELTLRRVRYQSSVIPGKAGEEAGTETGSLYLLRAPEAPFLEWRLRAERP